MKAGQSNLEVGTRVKINLLVIEDEEDKDLNGLIGTVTHPFAFGCQDKGWVGIWLEGGKANLPYGGNCNVYETECEII